MTKPAETGLSPYLKAVWGKKAQNIIALDVKTLTSIADTYIVCSGRSNRQTAAIAEHIQVELKKIGIKPLSVEGQTNGHWILMDYGDVIIHIFYEETRKFYNLEGLWTDARRIDTSAFEEEDSLKAED
jgi:ribosome-associated protein